MTTSTSLESRIVSDDVEVGNYFFFYEFAGRQQHQQCVWPVQRVESFPADVVKAASTTGSHNPTVRASAERVIVRPVPKCCPQILSETEIFENKVFQPSPES